MKPLLKRRGKGNVAQQSSLCSATLRVYSQGLQFVTEFDWRKIEQFFSLTKTPPATKRFCCSNPALRSDF